MTDATQPLQGRAALITGANRGLGHAIAQAYLEAGADVFLCARDATLMRRVAGEFTAAFPNRRVIWRAADVGQPDTPQHVVADAIDALPHLSILVNNAGVYGPMGPLHELDWNAWIEAINVNLVGSALMIRAVLPHLMLRGHGKIVQLSGGGATNPLPSISAYAASKAGIVRLIETVALEYAAHNIDANAIAPGALNTRLLDEVIAAGSDRVGADFHARAVRQQAQGGTGFAPGAALAVFLGSAASDGISGRLISAVWDRWEDWPQHRDELAAGDLYTLRRISGRERNTTWGDR